MSVIQSLVPVGGVSWETVRKAIQAHLATEGLESFDAWVKAHKEPFRIDWLHWREYRIENPTLIIPQFQGVFVPKSICCSLID